MKGQGWESNMYRIDENTSIDDTLITCAEYQLFLDKLRRRREYCQPDHWADYRFPAGQARRPVLGVRHSDAEAFCAWLTQREGEAWRYRLPNAEEAAEYPLKPCDIAPLGYWLAGMGHSRFAWNGPVPSNPRALPLDHAHALDHSRVIALDHDLAFTLALALDRALDLTLPVDRALNLDHSRVIALALDRDLAFTLAIALDRALDLDLAVDLDRARVRALVLDLYLDILTLQERIAGRSPAFEGIRMVRERNPGRGSRAMTGDRL